MKISDHDAAIALFSFDEKTTAFEIISDIIFAMTTITVLPEEKNFRAVAGTKESVGRTVGEAIDKLTEQLSDDENGTLLVIQNQRADKFFGVKGQKRLVELMAKKEGRTLSAEENTELESLVESELNGARERAEELVNGLEP